MCPYTWDAPVRRTLTLLTVGVIAFGVALVLRCPAPTALALLAEHVPAAALVTAPRGTLYRGAGRLAVGDPPVMESLSWRFQPLPLLLGRLGFAVSTEGAFGELRAQAGVDVLGRGLLRNLSGRLRAGDLASAYVGIPVEIGGTVEPELDVTLAGSGLSLEGEIAARNLSVNGERDIPLGGLLATVSAKEFPMVFTLSDTGGPLKLDGQVQLFRNATYTFRGRIGYQGDDAGLRDLLRSVGRSAGEGMRAISMSGRMPGLDALF